MRDTFVHSVVYGTFLKVMVACESFLQVVVACESFLKISVASQTFAVLFIKLNYTTIVAAFESPDPRARLLYLSSNFPSGPLLPSGQRGSAPASPDPAGPAG